MSEIKKDFSISISEIENMKHCIGFEKSKVTGTKHRKMSAYRNYYTTSDVEPKFQNLITQGLMAEHPYPRGCGDNPKCYTVTEKGFKFLSELTSIEITEME